MKVYISGPISGLTQDEYTRKFNSAATMLGDWGHNPVNPLDVELRCGETCNVGATKEDGSYLHSWDCYLRYDVIAMMECQAIFMLKGWGDSKGARLEMEIASLFQFDVFYEGGGDKL